ncbi:MAG: hypothetical protein B6U69_00035 [Thermofilum sp. ex4484_15]|nr:MAG: hypothetical protein B6U69_00035 [Thermofilum sp. ex4484_15]
MDVIKIARRAYAISWLSWLELSNWTNPLIFTIYVLIRPLFTLLLYAYIYVAFAISSGYSNPASAFYMVTGISFYNYIGSGIYGVAWVIHEEREHYRLLKYNYLAVPDLMFYLTSRGLIHYLIGLALSLVTLPIGLWLVSYDLSSLQVNLPLILINLILGYLWCTSLGIMVSAISLFSAEWGPLIAESTGGLLFLVGSVLFPAQSLPWWMQPLVNAIPMREWMELTRFALNPQYPIRADFLLQMEVIKTSLYLLCSFVFFKIMDKLVRMKGYLEATTEH